MQDFLATMVGRKLDVYCVGAASLRGEVTRVEGGILRLKDDDGREGFVSVDKVVVVWEVRDDEPKAGFVSPRAGFAKESGK